jgi:hypothetical protein
MENRYTKLFISLIVCIIIVYFSREFRGYYVPLIDGIPYIEHIFPEVLFDFIFLIALGGFFKITYLWIKELWNVK